MMVPTRVENLGRITLSGQGENTNGPAFFRKRERYL